MVVWMDESLVANLVWSWVDYLVGQTAALMASMMAASLDDYSVANLAAYWVESLAVLWVLVKVV